MGPKKRKDDISLTKIILGICLIAVIAFGVHRAARWFKEDYVGGALEAAAPSELARAEEAFQAGNLDEARGILLPIVEKTRNDAISPQALLLLARVEERGGDSQKCLAYLKRAAEEFPESPISAQAELAYARALEKHGQADEALAIFTALQENAAPEVRAPALCGLARAAERADDLEQARALCREAVRDAAWNSPDWDEAAEALGRLNIALIFSPKPTPESQVYTVERGDNLTNIGMKLNTTQGLLMSPRSTSATASNSRPRISGSSSSVPPAGSSCSTAMASSSATASGWARPDTRPPSVNTGSATSRWTPPGSSPTPGPFPPATPEMSWARAGCPSSPNGRNSPPTSAFTEPSRPKPSANTPRADAPACTTRT